MSKKSRFFLRLDELESRLTPGVSRSIGTFQMVDATANPVYEWKSGATDLAGSVIGTHNLGASIDVSYTLDGRDLTMANKIGDTIKGERVEWRNVGIKVGTPARDRVIYGAEYSLAIPKKPTFPVVGVIKWSGDVQNNNEVAAGTTTAKYHAFLLKHESYGADQWTSQIQLTNAAGNAGGTAGVALRSTSTNVFISNIIALDSPALPVLAAGQRYRIVTFDGLDPDTFTFTAANTTDLGLFAASSDAVAYDDDGHRMLDPSTTLDAVYSAGSPYAGAYAGTNKDLVARDVDGEVYLLTGYAYSKVPPGLTTLTDGQTVVVAGDLVESGSDALWLTFDSPTGGAGFVIYPDNSPLPTLSVSDTSVTEGNSGTTNLSFTVSLSAPAAAPVTVNYTMTPGTATSPGDFTASNGQLTFFPGETTKAIIVPANGDLIYERDEDFFVNIGSAVGATVADGVGQGTIVNDDSQPSISINDVEQVEGNSGTTTFVFTVTLSSPSWQTITVDFATADDTASAGSDYASTSGTLTFNPGETTKTISVTVYSDTINEWNNGTEVTLGEGFFVNLSSATNASLLDAQGIGFILDDD